MCVRLRVCVFAVDGHGLSAEKEPPEREAQHHYKLTALMDGVLLGETFFKYSEGGAQRGSREK